MSNVIYFKANGLRRVVFSRAHMVRLLRYHFSYTRDEAREAVDIAVDRFPNRVVRLSPSNCYQPHHDPNYKATVVIICVQVKPSTKKTIASFWKDALDLSVLRRVSCNVFSLYPPVD